MPKNVFWGPATFLRCFYVQKFIDLFTTLEIFYKFVLILFISFSYEPSRQSGTSPFLKTSLKIEMIVKGVSGKSGFFELPIELPIAYWPLFQNLLNRASPVPESTEFVFLLTTCCWEIVGNRSVTPTPAPQNPWIGQVWRPVANLPNSRHNYF